MEQTPKRSSLFSNLFSDSKQKSEPAAKKSPSTSIKYQKNFDELVLPTQKTEISYSKVLENAVALISTFTDNIPREIQQQICQQAVLQQSDGKLDQVLVEASRRKAQLMLDIKHESEQSEASVADINAEIDRLWNLRDQLQEESKQKQWTLSQSSDQLDQLISLLVDTGAPASAPEPPAPAAPTEPEVVVIAPVQAQSVALSSDPPAPSLTRNPRRLSTLATATH